MGLEQLIHRFRRRPASGDSPGPSFVWAVLVFAAVLCAGMGLLSDRRGLLDWDTYTRIHFIESYRPDLHVDPHLLYHRVQAWLMGMTGLTPIRSALLVTAISYAAFVTVVFSLCQREGLSRRHLALVLGMSVLGSPGLFWEFLAAEDNVAYLPVLALLFYWLPQPTEGKRRTLYIGVACGALVAVGMLINITMSIFLFAILAAPLLAWGGQKSAAVRLVVMSVVAIGLYYLSFLTVFYGCRIALHEYFPQALRLQNFDSSSGPIFSELRLEHYVVGFKSISWLPTAHFMSIPMAIRSILTVYLPWLLLGLYAVLVTRGLSRTLGPLRERLSRGSVSLVLFGIALSFPYFYEPVLVERWDIVWVGLLILLLRQARRPAIPFAGVCVALIGTLQLAGTALTAAHHYELLFVSPRLLDAKELVRHVRQQEAAIIVLPESTPRAYFGYIKYHARLHEILLARVEPKRIRWYRIPPWGLIQYEVSLSVVRQIVATTSKICLHPELDARAATALRTP